ncbi:MAG TPA: response regulator transcription factor [Candidatus Limnocylindrales bacterium]
MTDRTRVVLIDDHEMARRGLQAMLSTAPWVEVVGEAEDCEAGLAAVRRLTPDLVLLDIRMPGLDGLACLEHIKAETPRVAVVIVTLYDDRRYVLEALRRGAAGYLLKDASTAEVIQTLENVASGQLAVDPQLLREALAARDEAVPAPESVRQRAEAYSLTPREHDVLRLVADGLTNKEIGGRLQITEDTVKKHVQNIIWKLRAADRTQAAILALRLGLLEQDG